MLAAVLLGPWVGTIVMACVIAVQGLVFQDGGLLAMGANIFNMGVIGTFGGFLVYITIARAPRRRGPAGPGRRRCGRVAVRGGAPRDVRRAHRQRDHVGRGGAGGDGGHPRLIGVGEALITVAALGFISVVPPGPVPASRRAGPGRPLSVSQGA